MAFCLHQHDCEEHECAGDWSLFENIDIPGVTALNEAVEGSAKSVFKPWEQRLDLSTVLASNDDDAELIIFIPFTMDVKIKSICIIGGVDGSSPSKMRAFLNRDDIDFSQANDLTPIQEWELAENIRGELEYPTKYAKFQGVASVTLHFPQNFGANATRLHYIGFRGEATKMKRDAIANTVYEAVPNPSEHKYSFQHIFLYLQFIGPAGLPKNQECHKCCEVIGTMRVVSSGSYVITLESTSGYMGEFLKLKLM